MSNKVFSYHTFIFPFTWDKDCKKKTGFEFNEIFCNKLGGNIWEQSDEELHGKTDCRIDLSDENKMENRRYYCAYQFFNEAGRNIIFDESDNSIIYNYRVKSEVIGEHDTQYVISLKNIELKVDITGIYLKVFNTGIAVFYMNCVNREHPSLEAVKQINEYGRRISLSFWPKESNGYKKCADKLLIKKKKESDAICVDDFNAFISSKSSEVSLTYISKLIRDLLNKNGRSIYFSAKNTAKKNEIQIRPILDGKMYVSCCIADSEAIMQLQKSFDEVTNSFSDEQEKNLVELMIVDLEGACSYINTNSRREFLNKHLYQTEFAGKNAKLLAITDQACIKLFNPIIVNGEMKNEYEIDYHNHIYNQIILVGIAQRMTIANFQQEIAKISYGIENPKKKIDNKLVKKIMEMQERYVAFQNQFLLFEVTAQREGTYIYNKIQEELHVKEENETLSNRLSAIYELANINQDYGFNKWALVLSMVALVCTIFSAINDANNLSMLSIASYSGYAIVGVEFSICVLIICFILNIKYKK